jgi:hypothetical protein
MIDSNTLYLGARGGLWTPRMRLWISEQRGLKAQKLPHAMPVIIVAESRDNAEYLLDGCQTLGLELAAALCLDARASAARDSGGADWTTLARAVFELGEHVLLLALETRLRVEQLLRCHPRKTVLFLSGDASHIDLGVSAFSHASESPAEESRLSARDSVALARAMGWAAVDRPGQAVEATRLLALGLRPKTRRVLALARTPRAAEHLQRAMQLSRIQPADAALLADAQLPFHQQVMLAPGRQYQLSRALAKLKQRPADIFDAALCAGRVPRALGIDCPQLALGPVIPPQAVLPAGEATLNALSALLDIAPQSFTATPASAQRPPKNDPRPEALPESIALALRDPRRMAARLGAWRSRELLSACLEHLSPSSRAASKQLSWELLPAMIVTSGSAAANAAKKLSAPLWLRATGPELPLDAPHLSLQGVTNAAAARQGFHDLIFACEQHYPGQAVDGVLLSPTADNSRQVEMLVVWIASQPLLRVASSIRRTSDASAAPPLWLSCAQDAIMPSRWGKALDKLISVVCDAALLLASTMRWMRLRVVLGEKRASIVDVDGETTWPDVALR